MRSTRCPVTSTPLPPTRSSTDDDAGPSGGRDRPVLAVWPAAHRVRLPLRGEQRVLSAVSPATAGKWAVPSRDGTVEGSSASQAFWRCALNGLDGLSPNIPCGGLPRWAESCTSRDLE